MAARAGATYVSHFIGRLYDINVAGMDLILELVQIFANYDLPTNVLATSVRSPRHVTDTALAGAQVATIPTNVFDQMLAHPLTDKGSPASSRTGSTAASCPVGNVTTVGRLHYSCQAGLIQDLDPPQ
jgi:transaldolase